MTKAERKEAIANLKQALKMSAAPLGEFKKAVTDADKAVKAAEKEAAKAVAAAEKEAAKAVAAAKKAYAAAVAKLEKAQAAHNWATVKINKRIAELSTAGAEEATV
jgi:hypothetical protein